MRPEEYMALYRRALHHAMGTTIAEASVLSYQDPHFLVTLASRQPDGSPAPTPAEAAAHHATLTPEDLQAEMRQLDALPSCIHKQRLTADREFLGVGSHFIASVPACQGNPPAVARRLAACWNVCRAISPADLQPDNLLATCFPGLPTPTPDPSNSDDATARVEANYVSVDLAYLVRVFDSPTIPHNEYAARLGACWNACRGILTARLEEALGDPAV